MNARRAFQRALVVACIGMTAVGDAKASASDLTKEVHVESYRPIYTNDWRSGIGDIEIQAVRPSDVMLAADPADPARRSIRVHIQKSENFTNLINGSPRAEFTLPRDVVFSPGHDYLILWRTYLPRDFALDGQQMEIITQIHQSGLTGSPPFMLTLLGNEYTFSVRGGTNTAHGFGGRLCCASDDRGKWVDWALQYTPDASGEHAITRLWKNGTSVFEGSGKPNAYPGDVRAYLKFGVYKPDWQKEPSDIDAITLYFGKVVIGDRKSRR
ncbi:heparin lyase I family protein [Burkholderia sp. 22313]|uniref:heparin lyase I family protein n=1 Tax=Burkholderia sp. 22313 TaxID=3453908 RepID=UPI003F83E8F0